MLKKFSKLLILLLAILTASSICYATDAVAISETEANNTAVVTSETETSAKPAEHQDDLYIIDSNVVIDNIVYGNVYAIGNTVEITGQIEGNLFVVANTLKIDSSVNKGGYVGGSIYAYANDIYYNGASTYLYSVSNKLEMTYDSYVIRDVKARAQNLIIKSAIGRNANLVANTINFGEGENIPIFYGKLNYSAPTEFNIPDNVVTDRDNQITYTKLSSTESSITDVIFGFGTAMLTALALYIILNKLTPNFINNISTNIVPIKKLLKALLIGLITTILVILFTILLTGTIIGTKLALILILLFTVLCFVAVPALSIAITKTLKPALKIEKDSKFLLVLALVSIVLYGLTLIPFAGILLNFIIKVTAIGLIVSIYLPQKELSDEEKAKKSEAKKLAKEEKDKIKQEKLEAKVAKKQAKLEKKEVKKKD